ncbi:M15 family metallopeptidase [Paenibacillus soyae]|uniref:M15 family metallopeptidase n=1 Tax=Paenibacillus soyae TaxID=2969249 RepID=A0A9X2MRZ1_9BACL|nr:M15 family metallopeptidase [Paenibacillus soyae]MCR2805275.1 M15 family metallopeptidase [Paenibacillus soyae]
MMGRGKFLLFAALAAMLVVGGYVAVEEGGWMAEEPKLAEQPQAEDGAEGLTGQSGGQITGEAPQEQDDEPAGNPEGSEADAGGGTNGNAPGETNGDAAEQGGDDADGGAANGQAGQDAQDDGQAVPAGISNGEGGVVAVVAKPESIEALVNPFNKLPEDYAPTDLVYPDVRFTFSEKIEKRMMRKEAAEALEKMFAGAEEDGIYLAGVSAYRSHETQEALFDRYVKRDGYEKARTYSALPGTSEHETGLAVDVSGSDGKCAAADCFGDTKEADWLKKHAAEYGFIIRYPEGKKDITGYQYEPWHLRYVGIDIAEELAASGETLEEYYDAVPVNG